MTALLLAVVAPSFFFFLRHAKPDFDAARAFEEIERQVAFGPRVPGSEGHQKARAYFVETLQQHADRVSEQAFTYTDRHDSTKIHEGVNILASFNLQPTVNKRVLLAAHWDTRPVADRDPDPARHTRPVPGANDGASGVAVLLEMARLLHIDPPDIGVDIVLFDLEDLGDEGEPDSIGVKNPFAIGSAYFAEHQSDYRPTFGILLDMVCDKNLRIPREGHSVARARPIVDKVWAAAKKVGASAFLDEPGPAITDDHVAFLQRGIRVIDLIHTPFPSYGHTTEDTPDQCSEESLQQVGDVLVEVIYSE
ncbi:MAG: M28 family peptidase [Rhodothermales bacterium]